MENNNFSNIIFFSQKVKSVHPIDEQDSLQDRLSLSVECFVRESLQKKGGHVVFFKLKSPKNQKNKYF